MFASDLIRYFNTADQAGTALLLQLDTEVVARFGGYQLRSLFRPVVNLRLDEVVGHAAELAVQHLDGQPASIEAIYANCLTGSEVIQFDRLCRTLHALNYLQQRAHAGGYLQVPVHLRHLQAVPNQHGLVYEAILRRCGLAPEDIVLEVRAGGWQEIGAALENYVARGYRLALVGLPVNPPLAWLREVGPAIVRLTPDAAPELCHRAQAADLVVQWAELSTPQALAAARALGVDLGIGDCLGPAQARCLATHSTRRVAYNSAFAPGVQT